jgi:hypothetical protein
LTKQRKDIAMAVLKLDAHGADVVALQRALKARGFDPGVPDGDFGPGTGGGDRDLVRPSIRLASADDLICDLDQALAGSRG